ncbi:MAG: phage tail tape measure protein [Pseudomonadota bacterium]
MDDVFGSPAEVWNVKIDADTKSFDTAMKSATDVGRQFSTSLINAFEGIAVKGKSLGEVLRKLALDLSQLVLKAAFKPLEQGFEGLLSGLMKGGLGTLGGGGTALAMVTPFADGGVIRSPIAFPLGTGSVGLAGERGAEAILPLARGPDGRLGVAAGGGGGGVNVTFNVSTPDPESFRRTETQLAAMLARAISLGQRNL